MVGENTYCDSFRTAKVLDKAFQKYWSAPGKEFSLHFARKENKLFIEGNFKQRETALTWSEREWSELDRYLKFRTFAPGVGVPQLRMLRAYQGKSYQFSVAKQIFSGTGDERITFCEVETPILSEEFLNVQPGTQNSVLDFKTGIILTNYTDLSHPSGTEILLGLHPHAILVLEPWSNEVFRVAQTLAEQQLVVVGIRGDDPVEILFECLHRHIPDKRSFLRQIVSSFVHNRVRLNCESCSAKSIPSPQEIAQLPRELRSADFRNYRLGQGCSACKETGFRGDGGLNSIFHLSDQVIMALEAGRPYRDITRLAFESGARSVLYEAFELLLSGRTALSEIFRVVKRINPILFALEQGEKIRGEGRELDSQDFFTSEAKEATHHPSLLLVEDDYDQRETLKLVFEAAGYTVHTAANGEEGVRALRSGDKTDVVVCDYMMPRMNGEEFVRYIRSVDEHRALPVLMLTALDDENTEFQLLSSGADDFCGKGTKGKIILKRLERLRARSQNPL
ncbi:MAG: response regulator [Bdellovibrionales bacterium]|nr:response regulator [Bdellovibrionales bacterium]